MPGSGNGFTLTVQDAPKCRCRRTLGPGHELPGHLLIVHLAGKFGTPTPYSQLVATLRESAANGVWITAEVWVEFQTPDTREIRCS